FMHSYGLKPWNNGDVEEGKAILEGLKQCRMKTSGTSGMGSRRYLSPYMYARTRT
ncbi:hypothetical protein K474DRAFT_1609691, partial [Panus rudis PR-1116 ss-1]